MSDAAITLVRLEGWEGRLAALIQTANGKPYCLGQNDCFRLACGAIEALTGVDRWPEWAGKYTTRRECLALMAGHGHNFTEAASWFFGSQPVSWKQCHRGDILEYRDAANAAHLVICNGDHAIGMLDAGLVRLRLNACVHGWRIG